MNFIFFIISATVITVQPVHTKKTYECKNKLSEYTNAVYGMISKDLYIIQASKSKKSVKYGKLTDTKKIILKERARIKSSDVTCLKKLCKNIGKKCFLAVNAEIKLKNKRKILSIKSTPQLVTKEERKKLLCHSKSSRIETGSGGQCRHVTSADLNIIFLEK